MSRTKSVPSYRLHKSTGQAVITIPLPGGRRRDIYLGKHNSPESLQEYGRIVAELAAGVIPLPAVALPATNYTIDMLLDAYLVHADQHYRHPSGEPTSEVAEIER